ncbi:MAG: D-glycerate dehydrogenase [Actinobacteria bacterium]|nr:D-glycerate dehydrogenase [Actinomycetota bacterium]
MKPKVFVTRKLPEKALEMIRAECDMEINPHDRVLTKEELISGISDKDGMLCLLTDEIDEEVIDSGRNLRIIANYAVGYNNIDVSAATKRKIPVTNTPGVLTDTTADMAWALIFAIARRVVEADKFTREGMYKGWGPMMFLGGDIYRKTLGIVGLGRIGKSVAKRAKGFDMRVLYFDAFRADEKVEKELSIKYVSLEELLKESDFVSIHVPLLPSTHHLIGEKELLMMKKTAYLINNSRGPVIDEEALVKALRDKEIAGAALDVFENEPEISPGLADLENVVLTPHISSASIETRTKMAVIAAENLLAGLKGIRPPNIVNPEVLEQ